MQRHSLLFVCLVFVLQSFILQTTSVVAETFGPYEGTILEIPEADTLYVEVEVWPNTFRKVYVRLKGVDSPEPKKLNGGRPIANCEIKAAQKAIQFVEHIFSKSKTIRLTNVTEIKSTSNYVFARVHRGDDDLGEMLVNNKHAISLSNLKRKRWSCKHL